MHRPNVARNLEHPNLEQLLYLSSLKFIHNHENIIISGGAGSGKTLLATTLAYIAENQGLKVQLLDGFNITQYLESSIISQLITVDLLVIDDFGAICLSDTHQRLLCKLLLERAKKRASIITSTYPITTWHSLFGTALAGNTLLDALTSYAHVIQL
jgi:DNA replication protein DnaC